MQRRATHARPSATFTPTARVTAGGAVVAWSVTTFEPAYLAAYLAAYLSLFKLSLGVTCHPYLLEIDGLLTHGWLPGRTVGESVDGIF